MYKVLVHCTAVEGYNNEYVATPSSLWTSMQLRVDYAGGHTVIDSLSLLQSRDESSVAFPQVEAQVCRYIQLQINVF